MMNGTSRLSHKRVSIASRVMVALATLIMKRRDL